MDVIGLPHDLGATKRNHNKNNSVMHSSCRRGQEDGYFQIKAKINIKHIAAFVRINGPVVETIFFDKWDNGSIWRASYCTHIAGNYSAAVYIYLQSNHPEDILIPNSGVCVDPLFYKPFMVLWSELEIKKSQSLNLWYWKSDATNTLSLELSKYRCPSRDDYVTAYYSGLGNLVPKVNYPDLAPSGKVCLCGDSQIRNLLIFGGLLDPLSCFPPLQQIVYRGDCDVNGFQWKGFRSDFQWKYDKDMAECRQNFVWAMAARLAFRTNTMAIQKIQKCCV